MTKQVKINWKGGIIISLSIIFILFLSSFISADECIIPPPSLVACSDAVCPAPFCEAVYGGGCIDLCAGAADSIECEELNCIVIPDEPEPEIPETPEDEIYSYDLISNAREWFACNASGQIDLLGDLDDPLNYVDEYDTFYPTYGYDEVNCLEYFNDNYWDMIPEEVDYEFTSGYAPAGFDPPEFVDCGLLDTNEWCCYALASETNMGNCLSECYAADANSFISEYPNSDQQCEELGIGCDNPGVWWDVISGDYPKDVCGPWLACFGGLQSISPGLLCEDQGPSGSTQLCYGETPLCSGGTIINSSDTTTDSVCCLGEAAECIPPIYEGDDCVLSGGVMCEFESECFGQYENGCCFGGDCIDIEITNSLDKEQSYICYAEQGNSKFAECCYEGKCDNEFKGKGYLFGRGVSLHTINNYDIFDTTEQSYKDYVTVKTASSDDDLDITIENKFSDWSEYEYFEFIFASNALSAFDELFIEYDDTIESAGQVSDLLAIKDKNDFRWNYIILDLSTLTHIDSKEVRKITLTVKDGYSNVYAAFDNLILRDSGDSNHYNSENYYCTGGFGTWIDDLDYSEDPAIALAASYDEKRPHSYACNVQMAFDWTGNFCCGDDTRFNYGEFFNDDLAACFNGSFVPNDMTLANATNDYTVEGYNQHLLFYEGEFWVCGEDAYDHFDDYTYSYDGLEGSASLINSGNKVSFFENKGSWYCDPSGWLYLKDAKRLKIIAAKLLELAGENDYSLHCGNAEDVMNLQEGYIPSEGFAQTDNFCVLETNGDVIIGTGVSKENMNQFLNINLKSFHPVYETDATTYTCDFDDTDVFNATFFLRRCAQSDLNIWLNASYNPHFGILFFSLQKGEPLTGFLGFVVDVWERIVSFFENLFEGGTQSVEYVTVPKNATFGDFEELFIKQVGEKTIEAIREEKALVIKYKGFSDVTFLKDLTKEWFVENGYEHYNITLNTVSGNEQILGINGTTVDQFPWNYLTSNLKFE